MMRLSILFGFILYTASLSAQRLIPYVGIEDDSVVINESTIHDVLRLKGQPDSIYNIPWYTVYAYTSRGVAYRFHYYDASKIIRAINVTAPFQGCSTQEICLGVTSWHSMQRTLETPGGAPTRDAVVRQEEGISYYIRHNGKKTWDTTERIFMITVHGRNRYGKQDKMPGYVYDSIAEQNSVMRMTDFMIKKRSLKAFHDSFPETTPRPDIAHPYAIRRTFTRERTRECGQIETHTSFHCGQSTYFLVFFSKNDTIYNIALRRKYKEYTTVFADSACIYSIAESYRRIYPGVRDTTLTALHNPEIDYYAQGCGESMYCNPWCQAAKAMADAKDTAQLYQWLSCGVPEKQAFALYSLSDLQARGMHLSDRLVSTMLHVAQLRTTVYSCQGCVTFTKISFRHVVSARTIRKQRRS